jgi:hypothetical protein
LGFILLALRRADDDTLELMISYFSIATEVRQALGLSSDKSYEAV